jgi:hypothetical protein
MRVKTTTVIQALKSHAGWVDRLPKKPRTENVDRDFKAANIIEGCLAIMAASAHCDIRRWMADRPRRKRLKRSREVVWTREGRKAVRELLALTISELESSRSFRKDVDVGPLPIAEPRKTPDSKLAALARGRETQKQNRERIGHENAA